MAIVTGIPWHIGCSPSVGGTRELEEDKVAKEDRGFASMDRSKQREIASKGGRAAHKKGKANEWTREEAQAAGRKGGLAGQRRQKESGAPLVEERLPQPFVGEQFPQP